MTQDDPAVAQTVPIVPDEPAPAIERRDRLLAALTLIAGLGLVLGVPFALQYGAEFFLPLTIALVIAVALVPLLEWLERHRVPSMLAALICVLLFIAAANVAIAAIVIPATDFFQLLPKRIGRIQHNLAPLLDLYSSLERSVNRFFQQVASTPIRQARTAAVAPPSSILELAASSAPVVIIQAIFAILTVFFFLSGWTGIRRRTITERASFDGALATARVIQAVVDDVSAYLGTITIINLSLGGFVAGVLYLYGMPYPLMWGGIVTLLNFIPYFGALIAALLLAVGGLMLFNDIWLALVPAIIMYGCHLVEANVVTPFVVGHRLTISPLMILIALSFWTWVWGTAGALLAVPLLIIGQTVLGAAGKPDIAGFLFEQGALVKSRGDRRRWGRRHDDDAVDSPEGLP